MAARRSSRIANPHLRRMWALAYVIPKRRTAADVWFAEARALLSDACDTQAAAPSPMLAVQAQAVARATTEQQPCNGSFPAEIICGVSERVFPVGGELWT